jgi:hypothetical protein
MFSLLLEELKDDQPGAEQQLAWARSYTSSFTSGRSEVLSLLMGRKKIIKIVQKLEPQCPN